MSEYRVIKVSEQEPKKYEGQYGITYYIKVMVDGHSKPLEIGKKTPDAIKVSDILNGTIIPTEFQTDKFKAEPKAFGPKPFGKEDPAKQDSIIRQSSMKAAVDLVVSGKIELDNLYVKADEIVAWVKNDKPVDKPVDKELQTGYEKAKANWGKEELPAESINADDSEIDLESLEF